MFYATSLTLSFVYSDNMIKNHFNTSLQRQKRRLRRADAAPSESVPKDLATSSKAQESGQHAAPRSLEDRFAAIVKNIRPASRSVSTNFGSMLNPPSSASSSRLSGSLSMSGLGLGLSQSSSYAASAAATLSGSTSQYTSPSSIQYPRTYSDQYTYSPLTSAHSLSSASMSASPSMPSRYSQVHPRYAYHPYSRIEHPSPEGEMQYRAEQQSNSTISAGYDQAVHLIPPSTPETSIKHSSYAVYCPPERYNNDNGGATEPVSAPSTRENFNVFPTTPARR